MYYTNQALAVSAMLAGFASAAIIKVEVGQNNGFRFTPNDVKAAKGDIVEFHFDGMHSVIAGDFSKACNPVSSGGFYSDEMPHGDQVSTFPYPVLVMLATNLVESRVTSSFVFVRWLSIV
jgi:plastocyanin